MKVEVKITHISLLGDLQNRDSNMKQIRKIAEGSSLDADYRFLRYEIIQVSIKIKWERISECNLR